MNIEKEALISRDTKVNAWLTLPSGGHVERIFSTSDADVAQVILPNVNPWGPFELPLMIFDHFLSFTDLLIAVISLLFGSSF